MSPNDPQAIATGWSVGEVLLEALGLTDQHVNRVVIDVESNKEVRVDVTRYVTNEQGKAMFEQLTTDRYKLVPVERAAGKPPCYQCGRQVFLFGDSRCSGCTREELSA